LKSMARKKNPVVPHNKVLWAEIGFEAKNVRSLGHHTNTKVKNKVQIPTRVATNEENLSNKESGFVLPRQILFVPQTEC
jgi:hypothetical protein